MAKVHKSLRIGCDERVGCTFAAFCSSRKTFVPARSPAPCSESGVAVNPNNARMSRSKLRKRKESQQPESLNTPCSARCSNRWLRCVKVPVGAFAPKQRVPSVRNARKLRQSAAPAARPTRSTERHPRRWASACATLAASVHRGCWVIQKTRNCPPKRSPQKSTPALIPRPASVLVAHKLFHPACVRRNSAENSPAYPKPSVWVKA